MFKETIDKYITDLRQNKELYVRIKVRPGATRSEIKDIMDDETIKIDIAAPPEKGRANQELIRFLSKEFNINKNSVTIISGRTEKIKLIKIKI